jgi:trehalose/maltose hydrolase-like predicted phosphorylase
VHDQVRAALAAPLHGWDGLLRRAARYLDEFWTTADVEIDGDAELQQAVRVRASSTCCRPARGPSAGRSAPRA